MSLFPSTLTGRILDDGVTEPPVIELQGISAGQLATVLTAYTPLETSTQHTADIGTNAAAIAALQGQVAALPAAPDLTPYALASDLAAAEGLIAANASGLTAVNTSLTLGLAAKASQSALDALQVDVDGKSTPASVDLKLSNHPTTAAMNSSIASANNATLASVATTYALKSVVDQLALDVAARQTAGDVAQAIATALLPLVSTSDLTAAVNLRTTPADVSQLIATALLPFVQQAAVDAALALRDARLDGHDTEILALQNAGPFATAGDLNTLQLTLQSAIDGILAEISTLGGATNLVNAPAWLGNVTWDLLAGTNTVRNLHATGPLSIALANDDWTLSFGCDAYTTQQTDDAISTALSDYFTRSEVTITVVAAIDESKGYTDTQLADYSTTAEMTQAITDALVPYGTAVQRDAAIAAALAAYYTSAQTDAAIAAGLAPYSTTVQMNQAITDALVPFETAVQRDAAIAAALAAYYTSVQTDAAIAAAIAPYYTSAETDAAIAAAVALSNGQSWTGGPTFNLLRGGNVLRNLSVAGALTATFQNLDDTILIESDSYARSETYTQLETGAAITAAIDALDLSQFQNEAEVLALIAAALVPYWDQGEVSSFVAGELANYATSSSVTSAISSALSSYDNSSQVDSKIITALLDFYTRAEVDQEIADALGNVDLSAYYTSAQTDSLFYPRAELDSLLTATLLQYWTSGRTQTEIDDAIAGAGFLTQAQADTRYFAVSANASFESLVRTNVTPPMIKALLPRAPLAASTILTDTTLELTCDAYTKAESDGRYLSSSSFAPLDARYFARNPAVAEGNGLFHLVQEQFTPQFIRSLLFRPPLTGRGILGNFSVIEVEADCWSKAQSDSRYPLVATFNPGDGRRRHRRPRHRPGEQRRRRPHRRSDGQQPHRHHLRGDAPAAERGGRPPDPERPGDGPQGRRRAAGQLRRRRHQPGPGRHGGGGQHPERHHGGHHAAHRGQHGGHGRLQLQQQRHRQPGGRQQPPRRSAAGALRPDRALALDRRGCPGRPGQRHPPGQRGHRPGGQPALPVPLRRHHGAGDEHQVCRGHGARGPRRLLRAGGHQPGAHGSGAPLPGHKQQRRGRQGRAGGAGLRRASTQRPERTDELQHDQRAGEHVYRAQHGREQQRRSDLRVWPHERVGSEAQAEHQEDPAETSAAALRRTGTQDLRSCGGPQGSDRLRRPGRPGGRGTGQGALQAHGRRRAAGPGLPEALGGPVGRGEVPAEAGGQTREETG